MHYCDQIRVNYVFILFESNTRRRRICMDVVQTETGEYEMIANLKILGNAKYRTYKFLEIKLRAGKQWSEVKTLAVEKD